MPTFTFIFVKPCPTAQRAISAAFVGRDAGDGPFRRHELAHLAAEQFVDRLARALPTMSHSAISTPALVKGLPATAATNFVVTASMSRRVLADQQRREIGLMKCAAVTWSSPLHRGVQEASPRPTSLRRCGPSPAETAKSTCDPPRPLRIASSGLIGTRTGIVSIDVIFMLIPLPRIGIRGYEAPTFTTPTSRDAGCWNRHQRKKP